MKDGGLACSLVHGECTRVLQWGVFRCYAQAESIDDSGETSNGLNKLGA